MHTPTYDTKAVPRSSGAIQRWIELENLRPGVIPVVGLARSLMNYLRSGVFMRLRHPCLKLSGMARIPLSTSIIAKRISLGHRVQFGPQSLLHTDLVVGSHVLVGPRVSFLGRNDHVYNKLGKSMWNSGRGSNRAVIVEDDVWIGANATILSGVRIGKGSIVASAAVVTADVPENTIVGGNPAKVIKHRFTPSEAIEHFNRLDLS